MIMTLKNAPLDEAITKRWLRWTTMLAVVVFLVAAGMTSPEVFAKLEETDATQKDLNTVYRTIEELATGAIGRIVTLLAIVIGLVAGIGRGNLLGLVTGFGIGLSIFNANFIINQIFGLVI